MDTLKKIDGILWFTRQGIIDTEDAKKEIGYTLPPAKHVMEACENPRDLSGINYKALM